MSKLHDLKDALREAITDLDLSHDGTSLGRENAINELQKLGNAFADLFAFAIADFQQMEGGSAHDILCAECSADHIRDTFHDMRNDVGALDENEKYHLRRAVEKAKAAIIKPIGGIDNSGMSEG